VENCYYYCFYYYLTAIGLTPCGSSMHLLQPNKNMGFTHLQIERNPWLGDYSPQIPVLSALCPQLNL
jgi:hypothetical protein